MSSPDIAKNAIVILRSNNNTIIINVDIANSNRNNNVLCSERILLFKIYYQSNAIVKMPNNSVMAQHKHWLYIISHVQASSSTLTSGSSQQILSIIRSDSSSLLLNTNADKL